MKQYLELVDTSTAGRNDVTPLFLDHAALSLLAQDLAEHFYGKFDIVAGIDALGFILGTAVALHTKKGLLAIRKGGKLPGETDTVEFTDYSGKKKSLELRKDAPIKGKRVLLVDEWIETGSQVKAVIRLIETKGGIVAGIASINIDRNERTEPLLRKYDCF